MKDKSTGMAVAVGIFFGFLLLLLIFSGVLTPSSGGGGANCVMDEGTFVGCRPLTDYIGVPVTATEDAAGNRIDVTLVAYTTVYDDGVAQTQQPFLNFISGSGQTITCANNATATRTDCTFVASGSSGSGYATIQNNNAALTQRSIVNFLNGTNATISCVDDSGNSRTNCTVAASSSTGGYATIQASGSALTQRTVLNFQPGTALIASDDAGNTRTNVTLDADLIALAELASTGCVGRTGSGALTAVSLTQPASGLTITPSNCSANMVFALADDLAALEGLSTNGIAVRTAASAWTTLAPTDSLIPVATGTTWTTTQIQDCVGGTANNTTREVAQYDSSTHTFSCDPALPDIGIEGNVGDNVIPGFTVRGTGTAAMGNNVLYFFPFYVFTDTTISAISYEVTATAAGPCRTGIYNFSELLVTGDLVVDAGLFTPTTTGVFNVSMTPTTLASSQGRFAAALICTAGPTLRVAQGSFINALINPSAGTSHLVQDLRRSGSGTEISGLSNPGLSPTAAANGQNGFDFAPSFGASYP